MTASFRLIGPAVLALLLHTAGPACASAAGRVAGLRQPSGTVVRLEVDARDVPRGVFRARLVIPVSPGALDLAYPKWIPGEHGPTGPIAQLVNLRFEAAGKPVRWRRDSADMFLFHFEVPAGARQLVVWLDYASPFMTFNRGYGNSPNATPRLMTLLWNHLLLYPVGRAASDLMYQATCS